jgi:hypothetical protein
MRLLISLVLYTCVVVQISLAQEIPDSLKPWQDWVLSEDVHRTCARGGSIPQCSWSGDLTLSFTAEGGSFTLEGITDKRDDIVLPGTREYWPQSVLVVMDGRKVVTPPVVSVDEKPVIRLDKGNFKVSGTFTWSQIPEEFSITPSVGKVLISVQREAWKEPARIGADIIRVTGESTPQSSPLPSSSQDQIRRVRIIRLLQDEIPFRVYSIVEMQAPLEYFTIPLSKILLGHELPYELKGAFTASDPNNLTLRLTRGEGVLRFTEALLPSLHEIQAPTYEALDTADITEVWLWQPRSMNPRTPSGLTPFDSTRSFIPAAWRSFASFLVDRGSVLTLKEVIPPKREDTLHYSVSRSMLLNDDGSTFFIKEDLTQRLHNGNDKQQGGHRLESKGSRQLLEASVQGKPALLTTVGDSHEAGFDIPVGVGNVSVSSLSQRDGSGLKRCEWHVECEHVEGILGLSPGWDVLGSQGVMIKSTIIDSIPILGFIALITIGGAALFLCASALSLLVIALGAMALLLRAHYLLYLCDLSLLSMFTLTALKRKESLLQSSGSLLLPGLRLLLFSLLLITGTYWMLVILPQVVSKEVALTTDVKAMHSINEYTLTNASSAESTHNSGARKEGSLRSRIESLSEDTSGLENDFNPLQSSARLSKEREIFLPQISPSPPKVFGLSFPYYFEDDSEQTANVYFLSPLIRSIIAWSGVLCVLLLFIFMFRRRGLVLGLVGFISLLPLSSHAQPFPSLDLLSSLRKRLTRDDCLRDCAFLNSLSVRARGDMVEIAASVHSQALWNFPLPFITAHPRPLLAAVTLDGVPYHGILRQNESSLFGRVPPGRHEIALTYMLAPKDEVREFRVVSPNDAGTVSLVTPDWNCDGLSDSFTIEKPLVFTRKSEVKEQIKAEEPLITPHLLTRSIYRIDRSLLFSDSLRMTTLVMREGEGEPSSLRIPLLKDETLQDTQLKIEFTNDSHRELVLPFPSDVPSVSFTSILPSSPSFVLPAIPSVPQKWHFSCPSHLHCELQENTSVATKALEWEQPDGVAGQLRIIPLTPVSGTHTVINDVHLNTKSLGSKEQHTLSGTVRSVESTTFSVTLPESSEDIESVSQGNVVSVKNGVVEIPFVVSPGFTSFQVSWKSPRSLLFFIRSPPIQFTHRGTSGKLTLEVPPRYALLGGNLHVFENGRLSLFLAAGCLLFLITLLLCKGLRFPASTLVSVPLLALTLTPLQAVWFLSAPLALFGAVAIGESSLPRWAFLVRRLVLISFIALSISAFLSWDQLSPHEAALSVPIVSAGLPKWTVFSVHKALLKTMQVVAALISIMQLNKWINSSELRQ